MAKDVLHSIQEDQPFAIARDELKNQLKPILLEVLAFIHNEGIKPFQIAWETLQHFRRHVHFPEITRSTFAMRIPPTGIVGGDDLPSE